MSTGLAEAAENIDALEKILLIDAGFGREIAHGHFHDHEDIFPLHAGFLDELGLGAIEHVERGPRDRAKTAALDENRFFVKNLGRLDDFAIGSEHRGIGQAALNQLQDSSPDCPPAERQGRRTSPCPPRLVRA